ncbi:EF-hand domain-containing protein [Desulfovibrio sp. JC022]|uniref:EF-hand domain-containing protein n=1 Tax=Desulfovibrio sp. JC022 TaxID=2593642 RepID=UPI0013D6BA40|nr:EF-hand domain-containing protein [Desulfovibrio sp. JC022]NDV24014.1 EF-hand domain-containing protein [Desulfovibrio sp. JC022]
MSISGIDGPESSQLSAGYAPDESRISEQRQQGDFLDSLMISKDKDSNGVLSFDESGLTKEKFSKLDADGNGQVSPSEVQAVLDKLQKEKGELGKLDVQMQQAEEVAAKAPNPAAQQMVGFEESGLDEDTFNMLDSDGDGKVSQADIDSVVGEEQQPEEQGDGSLFSEALSEFEKNFFRKEEDEEEKDLNKDGVVSEEEELQAEKLAGINAEKTDESEQKEQQQGPSARHMAGIRAYQNQASEFFAAASQSSVKFQY